MTTSLQVVHLHGINTDSLGQYLMALGVLSAASQEWPDIRGCWRNGHFVVLGDSLTPEGLETFLSAEWQPTDYERWWSVSQKKDTKSKSTANVWAERNDRPARDVRVLDAHIVPVRRNQFNPVLGTGGNVGKRDLAKAAKDAKRLRTKPEGRAWLHGSLTGEQTTALPDFSNAGTWFVYANKTFNSGQSWFREGKISPWSFLLALEGALLLVGGVNKRLATRARPYAVFPFISDPASPESSGEVALSKGEFWAPLWVWPATYAEVRSLFQRGLARLGGHPAKAPHEFAVAALAAGVDAGIVEFARFELRQTTSSQVYEAIPREHIRVSDAAADITMPDSAARRVASELLMELIESRWLDRLPFEPRDAKQRGKFVGLRGPIESAIIRVSELPEPERWQQLLLRLADAQFHIDLNKTLRERRTPLPLLSDAWFQQAWPHRFRSDEIQMAAAIASVSAEPSPMTLRKRKTAPALPLLVNVFGVDVQARLLRNGEIHFAVSFPPGRPQRAVWHSGDPLQVLIDVAHRRLMDPKESDTMLASGAYRCPARIIDRLLSPDQSLDLEFVARWIPPLTLINWSHAGLPPRSQLGSMPQDEAKNIEASTRGRDSRVARSHDGIALLDALFRPLFQSDELWIGSGDDRRPLFDAEKGQQPPRAVSRRLFNLIRQGSLNDAIELTRSRYRAVQCQTVGLPFSPEVDSRRIAAGLLVPMRADELQLRFNRWIQPPKNVFSRRTI